MVRGASCACRRLRLLQRVRKTHRSTKPSWTAPVSPCQPAPEFASSHTTVSDYAALLAQLYARPAQPAAQGLVRMQALLAALGGPHRQVPSVVVAGTNGKGSTSYLIAETLRRAGHKTGLFTSPHLLTFAERIRINGVAISRAHVVRMLAHVTCVAAQHSLTPTFFEVTTAVALCYFAESKVRMAVLEVGLGGRLDATNAADKVLTVLTPISRDHEALLGYDIASIAQEKAAILHPGVPVVIAPQTRAAQAVIGARVAALELVAHESDAGEAAFAHVMPPYQRQNFACAQAAVRALDAHGIADVPSHAFDAAAAAFAWPGRYQWLWPGEQSAVALPCPVILDGSHNAAGALALSQAIAQDLRMRGRRIHVIFALVLGKDCAGMLAHMAPWAATWRVCGVRSKRRRDVAELAIQVGHGAQAFDTFASAWRAIAETAIDPEDRIIVCGSLFLVADALSVLTSAERDPPIDG